MVVCFTASTLLVLSGRTGSGRAGLDRNRYVVSRRARTCLSLKSADEVASTELGGGGGGGVGNIDGGGRDDGKDEGSSGGDGMEAILAFCAERGISLDKVDPRVMAAFEAGIIPAFAVINYLKAILSPTSSLFMKIFPWTMSRFLADELFLFKVSVEEGLGIFGKLSAEAEQRRGRFMQELDFVLCNLLTAFLVDFALVYLPAPSISLTGKGGSSWISELAKSLPSNVFAVDKSYSLAQRFGGYLFTASKLFGVGFACCFASALLTNSIITLRSKMDPNFVQLNEMQNPVAVSAMYATFLGVSSSTRYQLINGLEIHVLPALLGRYPKLITEAATLALRFGNTFWGSQQWVIFAGLTGVQKGGH